MNVVGNSVRAGARICHADAVVLFAQGQLTGADVEEPELDVKRITGPLYRCEHHSVGIQLAPTWEGNVGRGLRLRDGSVRVARNQIELALERQVIEEHLSHQLGGRYGLCVLRQRHKIRHRIVKGSADVAADFDIDVRLT